MPDQYKRSVCEMCPDKTECHTLRWGAYCGTCADSLRCMATAGAGIKTCARLKGAWLNLRSNCMLASQLLHSKAVSGEYKFIDVAVEGRMKCPRCEEAALGLYVDHALNYVFKRETKYILTCDHCGIDETIKLP